MTASLEQPVRTPLSFNHAQLLAMDFDNTIAQTFEASPAGIGVNEAYEIAVAEVFGVNSLEQYLAAGGLHNRAPREVVQELAPDIDGLDLEQLTANLVAIKLDILMGEIGTSFENGDLWPRPTPGYTKLRETIEQLRLEGLLIDDLILSSGHEAFIAKTCEAWEISQPNLIVATETVSELTDEEIVKPSPKLIQIAHDMWRASYGLSALGTIPYEDRDRMLYVGDDPVKDGQMAAAADIDFTLLKPEHTYPIWLSVGDELKLVGRMLLEQAAKDD